ncbi:MAG: type IV pilin [Candidatus Heimdallarchaeaceae archaeon]
MKKRAVSPVIATVLLIALVTAAAAIVFLVVMPMLNPTPTANISASPGSVDLGDGTRKITFQVEAVSGDLTLTNVSVAPYISIQVQDGLGNNMINATITKNSQSTVVIIGAFTQGTKYSFTFIFTAGDSQITVPYEHTA